MAQECFINFEKDSGKKLTRVVREKITNDYRTVKKQVEIQGKKLDSEIGDGKVAVDNYIDKKYQTKSRQITEIGTRKLASDYKQDLRLNEIKQLIEDIQAREPKRSRIKVIQDAIAGSIFTTNRSRGMTYEGIRNALRRESIGSFLRKLDEKGVDVVEIRKNEQLRNDIITELYEIYKNPVTTKSKTKNQQAFDTAKAFYEEQYKMVLKAGANGDSDLITNNRLRPKFMKKKVIKNREQFIKDIEESLDPQVHGDQTQRQQLANDIFDQMSTDEPDWRAIGAKQQQSEVSDLLGNLDQSTIARKPILAFKDGESFTKIVKNYGANDVFDTMLGQFDDLARHTSLVQYLGPDYNKGLDVIRNFARENGVENKTVVAASLNYLTRQIRPSIDENNTWARTFTTFRNIMAASKLGGATLTALLDIPTMRNAAKNIYGVHKGGMLSVMFGEGLKGTGKQRKQTAKYLGIGLEGLLGQMQERFNLRGTTGGAVEQGSSNLAFQVFKWSGLNAWTDGRKSMAANILLADLASSIKSKKSWNSLHPKMQNRLDRFGIKEKEWNDLLNSNAVRDDVLDVYSIPETTADFQQGRTSLRQKLVSFVDDGVNTMVLTPSQLDIEATSLFIDSATIGGQVLKSMIQFKAHPISFFRKQILATGQYGTTTDKIASIASMTAYLMTMSALVVQLKEIAAGKQPKDLFDPNTIVRVVEQAGVAGIVSDAFLTLGGSDVLQAIFGGEVNNYYGSDKAMTLLGPTLGDFLKTTGVIGSLTISGIEAITGKEEFDYKELSDLTQQALTMVPGQNLWWAKMLFRKYLFEAIHQTWDSKSYKRTQRRYKKQAKDQRLRGEYNNIIYNSLGPTPDYGKILGFK